MTTKWVLGCSFAAALALLDKSSTLVSAFFLKKEPRELWVPALWWYELANVSTVAERRRTLARTDVERAISLHGSLSIQTDQTNGVDSVRMLCEITRVYGLSTYDAACLELALRKRAPLASLNRELVGAAKRSGVETWR